MSEKLYFAFKKRAGKRKNESRKRHITEMDQTVGKIVNELKKTDHYNNTIIFFTSDNGATDLRNGKKSPNFPLR